MFMCREGRWDLSPGNPCVALMAAPGSWKLKLLWTKEAAQKSPFSAQHAQGFSLKCIKDQKVPIGVTVVVAALLLTIIALAVKKCPSYPSCPSHVLPSCLNNGIGYGEKCFYFIEDEAEWNKSRIACVSLGAHLATIDSWEELRFLLRYGRSLHYWLGLQREESGPWKWVNGSLFNNWFDVRGKGQCAYINQDGISSDWCSQTKFSVCSHRQNRPSAIQKDSETLPNFT
ncbi:C-type lectin domain family 2 member D [Columba guinea]|nr:C-type lectin domain family 2 member D [Columba guinea]